MKDLLPTYAAGECSDATRKAVDEHVATCATCSKSLRAMTEPAVDAEATSDPARKEELGKEMTFKAGFKKIRRRWLISILCILLIIPLSGLGFLGYNETRGEGYAFSNMKGLGNVNAYMKSLQKGDYEALLKYYDFEPMYSAIVNQQTDDLLYLQSYLPVEIGGAKYYVDMYSDRSQFEPYTEAGSDAEFWAQVIIENAENGQENLIPEKVFADAVQKVGNSLGEEITAIDLLSETPDSPYTYVLYFAPDGSGYYRPTNNGRLSELIWMNLIYIPETIFKTFMHDYNQKIEADREIIEAYQLLGLEEYTKMVKEKYIADMNELSAKDMVVESYTIGNPYRRSEDRKTTDPYEKSEKEYWFVDVEVHFSAKDLEMIDQIFTFKMDGDMLDVQGSFTIVTVDAISGGTSIYMYSDSPNPFVLEENSSTYLTYEGGVTVRMAEITDYNEGG
jgi:hypothetical protein